MQENNSPSSANKSSALLENPRVLFVLLVQTLIIIYLRGSVLKHSPDSTDYWLISNVAVTAILSYKFIDALIEELKAK